MRLPRARSSFQLHAALYPALKNSFMQAMAELLVGDETASSEYWEAWEKLATAILTSAATFMAAFEENESAVKYGPSVTITALNDKLRSIAIARFGPKWYTRPGGCIYTDGFVVPLFERLFQLAPDIMLVVQSSSEITSVSGQQECINTLLLRANVCLSLALSSSSKEFETACTALAEKAFRAGFHYEYYDAGHEAFLYAINKVP